MTAEKTQEILITTLLVITGAIFGIFMIKELQLSVIIGVLILGGMVLAGLYLRPHTMIKDERATQIRERAMTYAHYINLIALNILMLIVVSDKITLTVEWAVGIMMMVVIFGELLSTIIVARKM